MKKYILIILIIGLYTHAGAQDVRSEISVYGAGGLAGLKYSVDAGSHSMRFGGLAGVGYTLFFGPRWGIVTGIEMAWYGAECNLNDNYGGSYQAVSGTSAQAGNDFTFAYAYKGYSEKQTATYIQIPVMAQFQTGVFYAAGGVKVGFATGSEYKTSAASLATSGYFPAEGQTYTTLPDRGMGVYNSPATSGELDPGVNIMLALEAGAKWTLSDKISLYTGVYLDYGLSKITDASDVPVVEYSAQAPGKLLYHSASATAGSMNTIGAGLKIRIAYKL